MSTINEQISEKFVNGPSYLKEWRDSIQVREEFGNDFEAYCHYQAAYSNGQVRIMGVK